MEFSETQASCFKSGFVIVFAELFLLVLMTFALFQGHRDAKYSVKAQINFFGVNFYRVKHELCISVPYIGMATCKLFFLCLAGSLGNFV